MKDEDGEPEPVIAVTARGPIAKGEEITICYATAPNDHFVLHYGFVPQVDNTTDAATATATATAAASAASDAAASDAAASDAPGNAGGGGAAAAGGDGAGDTAAATTSGAVGGDPNPFDVTYIPFDNNIFQLGARLARYVPSTSL